VLEPRYESKKTAKLLHSFHRHEFPQAEGFLAVDKNEIVKVLEDEGDGWLLVENDDKDSGYVPTDFAEIEKSNPGPYEPVHDLLLKMLEKDPAKRITIKNALQHPYFMNSISPRHEIDESFQIYDFLPEKERIHSKLHNTTSKKTSFSTTSTTTTSTKPFIITLSEPTEEGQK